VNFSALPALLSHSGGHEENRQSLISARRRFFCTCGRTIPIANAGPRHEIVLMSFVETSDSLALKKSEVVQRFGQLIAPKSDPELEAMAQTSRALKLQNFGRTMCLFASLYLSNECINNCQYCGFSRDSPILRVTLGVDEVVAEAQHLTRQGFRQIFSLQSSIQSL
jgi:hypothetical protein